MLVLKICVNLDQIDEVHIQNVGYVVESGQHIYKIRQPEGFEEFDLYHWRHEGCIPLIVQAMELLEMNEYTPPDSYEQHVAKTLAEQRIEGLGIKEKLDAIKDR